MRHADGKRRGTPYDNAQAESFVKTLKVEAVYLSDYEMFETATAGIPRFIDEAYNIRRLPSLREIGDRQVISRSDLRRSMIDFAVSTPRTSA